MKRTLPLSLLAATCAVVLAACSSSPVASPTATGAAPVAGAEETVEAAQAELDKHTAMPTFAPPNDPFDARPLAGRKIAMVAVNQIAPALVLVADGVEQAAKATGITTTLYDAKDTPSEMTAGISQAIAGRADAIVLIGVAAELVSSQLAAAAKAGIPVIMADNSQPDAAKPGQGAGENIYATAAPDFELQGRLAAHAAIVRTGGDAKAVLVSTEGIQPAAAVMRGFTQGMKSCSTCEILDTRSVQPQDWSTGLGSLMTSILSKNSDANVILPIYVTMAIFMLPAVQQAGATGKVTLFSTSAPPDGAKLLESNPTLGGLSGVSDYAIGWLAVNQAMRGMLGLEPGNPTVPTRYLTAKTVSEAGPSEEALYGTSHESGFKKLWGLTG